MAIKISRNGKATVGNQCTVVLTRDEKVRLVEAAKRAGLSQGEYLARLLDAQQRRERDGGHILGGNCFLPTYRCKRCGPAVPCDGCHEHQQPRGECNKCDPCLACEKSQRESGAHEVWT